jgi:hypothetical protein
LKELTDGNHSFTAWSDDATKEPRMNADRIYRVAWMTSTGSMAISDRLTAEDAEAMADAKTEAVFVHTVKLVQERTSLANDEVWALVGGPPIYELHVYSATPEGEVSSDPVRVDSLPFVNDAAAQSAARKIARKEQGPVDVALKGSAPWSERYVGTASPKYPYSDCKVTIFERLD